MAAKCRASTLCAVLFVLFSLSARLGNAAESEECKALGFTGLQLCSDCDTLASYVKDDELVADCLQCCVRGKEAAAQKYTGAALEAWLERLDAFPHIEGFVKNEAQKYRPALKIVNRWHATPRLVMSAPGAAKHIVRVEGWKTENVVEYLDDMLAPPVSDAEVSEDAAASEAGSHNEGVQSE